MAETTEMKHKLIDLREEINVERDGALKAAKSIYDAAKIEEAANYKENITAINAEYKNMYRERKVGLMTEDEEA
jgi:hypothetical protein